MSRSVLAFLLLASTAVATAPPAVAVLRVGPCKVRDADGRVYNTEVWKEQKAVVLLFLGTECPVSNGYSPELARLAGTYGPRGVLFLGVHPDPDVTALEARRHAREYALPFVVLLDPHHVLAAPAGVELVPEVVVLTPGGAVVYRGRIDDRYGPDGRRREVVRKRDLAQVLEEVLAGKNAPRPTARGFGCPLPEPARRTTSNRL